MKLKLNLLPPSEKRELKLAKLAKLLVSFGLSILFLIIIFSLLMVSMFYILFVLLDAQEDMMERKQTNQQTQKLFQIEDKIKSANASIDKVYEKQRKMIVWTPILEQLSKITPSSISLNNFSYNQSKDKINLSGYAENRKDLLRYKGLLEQSEYFEKVDSPLSNIIKKEDIDFNFTIILVKKDLDKKK